MNASCDSSMLSRNLSQNQRPSIFEGQEIDETLSQDYIDPLVWKTGHSTAPESCHENDMNRRGGKREGAGRKKSPALAKITREINKKTLESKSSIYIFGKSCFLDLAKGPCGGKLRKRFKLCVMANGCSVCSSERRRQQ